MKRPGTEIRNAGRLPDSEVMAHAGTSVRQGKAVPHWRELRFPPIA